MVPKYVIDVSIIWLNDNIYLRNTWFPTTDVQTQNIGKLRYANRRAPTECRHTVATQATEYQRWHDVGCRSRRCRLMPTLGQRRNASWAGKPYQSCQSVETYLCKMYHAIQPTLPWTWLWLCFISPDIKWSNNYAIYSISLQAREECSCRLCETIRLQEPSHTLPCQLSHLISIIKSLLTFAYLKCCTDDNTMYN